MTPNGRGEPCESARSRGHEGEAHDLERARAIPLCSAMESSGWVSSHASASHLCLFAD